MKRGWTSRGRGTQEAGGSASLLFYKCFFFFFFFFTCSSSFPLAHFGQRGLEEGAACGRRGGDGGRAGVCIWVGVIFMEGSIRSSSEASGSAPKRHCMATFSFSFKYIFPFFFTLFSLLLLVLALTSKKKTSPGQI